MTSEQATYPVQYSVDYPEEERNRLTVFFRIFVAIPILIILGLVSGGGSGGGWVDESAEAGTTAAGAGGILFAAVLLMILFRQKYPRWWFDWHLALSRFTHRVVSYVVLLRDEYPSTDELQAVRLEIVYPDAKLDLNRWLPLVKWFLAIPHYIVLVALFFAAFVVTIIAWFAILFTGRYPRGMFDFVVGVQRWAIRVGAYAFLLTTDKYPPFSLD